MEESLALAAGHMLCIGDGRLTRICVHLGWGVITQEEDPEDAVVKPGAVFIVRRDRKAILVARTDMTIAITPACMRQAARVQIKTYVGPRAVVLREVQLAPQARGWLPAMLARISYERRRAAWS